MTRCTVSGQAAVNPDDAPVPNSATKLDGQHVDHWVLCKEERAKGFVRPVRDSYVHVGPPGPEFPLVDLTPEQVARNGDDNDYVKFEPYPPGYRGSALGHYWTQADIEKIGKGCGTLTRMPLAIAETYARQPGYYGSTFCCGCRAYRPVGARGEFTWADAPNERVGT